MKYLTILALYFGLSADTNFDIKIFWAHGVRNLLPIQKIREYLFSGQTAQLLSK